MSNDDNKTEQQPQLTAHEALLEKLRSNPRFKEAPKSGRGYVIGGGRLPERKTEGSGEG